MYYPKQLFSYLFIISVLIFSCIHNNDSGNADITRSGSVITDTSDISKLIQRVERKEYPNTDSARKILKNVEEWSVKNGYGQGLAKSLFWEGNLLHRENKYNEALEYYSKALDISTRQNFILLKANCLERMASVHLANNDIDLALKLYFESLLLFERINNTRGIAKVNNIIGSYYTAQDNFDTARSYLNRALEMNMKIGDTFNMIENQGNLGHLYVQTGEFEKAEKIFLSVAAAILKMKDKVNLPVTYYNLGTLYQKMNRPPKALEYMRKAILTAEENHDISLLPTIYGNTGEIFLELGKKDSASNYLQKSVDYSRKTGEKETEIQAMTLLINIDSLNRKYLDVITKLQIINALKDSVLSKELKNNQQTIILRYENQKKQNLIEIQGLTLMLQKRERWTYILLLVIVTTLIIFLSYLLIKRKHDFLRINQIREQEKLIQQIELERLQKTEEVNSLQLEKINQSVQEKEKELLSIALRIDQKNELLQFIHKKIKDLPQETTEASTVIQDLETSIQHKIKESKDIGLFNERFSALSHDFFGILRTTHPELTRTEVKFCAYLRLNLSSAQISAILNISPEGIKKNRHRIRKKLNLPQESSLEDYISRF